MIQTISTLLSSSICCQLSKPASPGLREGGSGGLERAGGCSESPS